MKFSDGSVAPAYNIQLAASGCFVIGLAVSDRRNDTGLAEPMVEQLVQRYQRAPARLVLDAKIATHDEIISLSGYGDGGVEVWAPVSQDRDDVTADSLRKRNWQRAREHGALKAWRARMQTDEAVHTAKRRRLIETLNGIVKNRGMRKMLVRGKRKVKSAVLFQALANNLMQANRLRQAT